MFTKLARCAVFVCMFTAPSLAAEESKSLPIELQVLKASIGVWDADIEVWPNGTDSPSINFKGVETNRAYGKHWIASDFDSEFGGQSMKVHSIVGYDLDKKQMVGTVIDDGPYAATMTGAFDEKTQSVSWLTKVKDSKGNLIVQRTVVTQENANERVLVLMTPGDAKGEFKKFMQIKFVKRN